MIPDEQRFGSAIAAFDAANAEDPNRETLDGRPQPRELVYARRMTAWLSRLTPEASEALKLAARSQHICRWMRPRAEYPATRAGYHRWRTALYQFHAEMAAGILHGFPEDELTIARVRSLVRKENLKTDAEGQTLEDVICLVFLENYFADFAKQHDDAKLIGILRKTWKKMSPKGQAEALKLALDDNTMRLVKLALEMGR